MAHIVYLCNLPLKTELRASDFAHVWYFINRKWVSMTNQTVQTWINLIQTASKEKTDVPKTTSKNMILVCQDTYKKPAEHWQHVLWSDETKTYLFWSCLAYLETNGIWFGGRLPRAHRPSSPTWRCEWHEWKRCSGEVVCVEWKDESQSQEAWQEMDFPTWQWSKTHCKNHTRF